MWFRARRGGRWFIFYDDGGDGWLQPVAGPMSARQTRKLLRAVDMHVNRGWRRSVRRARRNGRLYVDAVTGVQYMDITADRRWCGKR